MKELMAMQAYTDAVTQSAIDTLAMMGGITLSRGESHVHTRTEITDSAAVYIGVTGDYSGYVLIRFSLGDAKVVASAAMMGFPVETLDDMSISALSELGNMIMGGASCTLSTQGVNTDITTPTFLQGTVKIKQADLNPVSIPLTADGLRIVLDIAVKTTDGSPST